MRFCPQCGEASGDNQTFCTKCGAGIGAAPAAASLYYPPAKKAKSGDRTVIIAVVVIAILLLAVPILLIVLAIAIPNLMRARISANESSAAASIRTIDTAAIMYQSEYGHYPRLLDQLSQPAGSTAPNEDHAGLIDNTLAGRVKNGYVFTYHGYDSHHDGKYDSFSINADPIKEGNTGRRHFFCSEDGTVRAEYGRQASAESPPLD